MTVKDIEDVEESGVRGGREIVNMVRYGGHTGRDDCRQGHAGEGKGERGEGRQSAWHGRGRCRQRCRQETDRKKTYDDGSKAGRQTEGEIKHGLYQYQIYTQKKGYGENGGWERRLERKREVG